MKIEQLARDPGFMGQVKRLAKGYINKCQRNMYAVGLFEEEDIIQECMADICECEDGKDPAYYYTVAKNHLYHLNRNGYRKNKSFYEVPYSDLTEDERAYYDNMVYGAHHDE